MTYIPNNILQGLDGEATEPITEQLREPAAEEQDPEQQFAVARVLAQPVEQGADSGEQSPSKTAIASLEQHPIERRVTAHPEQTLAHPSQTSLQPFSSVTLWLGVLHNVSKV